MILGCVSSNSVAEARNLFRPSRCRPVGVRTGRHHGSRPWKTHGVLDPAGVWKTTRRVTVAAWLGRLQAPEVEAIELGEGVHQQAPDPTAGATGGDPPGD